MKFLEWIITRTNKNSLYLSGPMTGYKKLNRPLFSRFAKKLRQKGYTVVNPAELGDAIWIVCLTRDLVFLLLFCNKIAVLPGWKKSKGATLEVHVAKELDMPVHKVEYWLNRGKR